MAEQDTEDIKEDKLQSTNMEDVSPCDDYKQDGSIKLQHPEDLPSSCASTNTEAKSDSGDNTGQADVKKSPSKKSRLDAGGAGGGSGDVNKMEIQESAEDMENNQDQEMDTESQDSSHGIHPSKICQDRGSAEDKMTPHTKGSSSHEDNEQDVEESDTSSRADDGSHGDCNREKAEISSERAQPSVVTSDSEKPETISSQTLGDRDDNQVCGPKTGPDEHSPGDKEPITEAAEDDGRGALPPVDGDVQKNAISGGTETDGRRKKVETIGSGAQDTAKPTEVCGGTAKYLVPVCIVVVVAILWQQLLQPESPPQKDSVRQIDVFLRQMETVKSQFPNQRAELWSRSRIHLLRHLQTAQPTEPVSLILTAGLRAKTTLHCLARDLASAFSAALNASVLHIDGASKASQDSDLVKLDIDAKLQGAFEGDKPVAVIHHFEELPPGSTLIFYRYCDHENAAYKKIFLIFTVLLGEEEEIPAKLHLSAVEEMVDDHLQKKFLSHGRPVSFDRMDLDKYGGLWSRISHLILPVAAEERIEHAGCT